MQMRLLRIIVLTNSANIIIVFVIAILLASLIATGGFSATSDPLPEQQYLLALSILPAVVLFGVSVLIPSLFNPNQQQMVELHASQPYPYWKVVRDQAYVSFGVVACASLVYLSTALLVTQLRVDPSAIVYWAGSIAWSVICIGVILLAIAYGRDGRFGYITGGVLFLLMSQLQLPDSLLLLDPARFQADYLWSLPWWLSRAAYIIIGVGCGMLALKVTANTDFLLLGAASRRRKVPQKRKRSRLMQDRHPLIALVFYQTQLMIVQGIIPVTFLVGTLYSLISIFQTISFFGSDSLSYNLLTTINTTIHLLLFFLPMFLVDITQRDRDSGLLEVMLTVVSPARYLANRALGIAGALAISLVVSVAIPYGVVMVVILLTTNLGLAIPFTQAVVGVLLLGLLPGTIYLGVMSFFFGAIFHSVNRVLLRIGALSIPIILTFSSMSTIIGSVLFPTGWMAYTTTTAWYQQFLTSVIFIEEAVPPETIVDFPVLLLPLVSVGVQIVVAGFVSAKVFEYTTRRS